MNLTDTSRVIVAVGETISYKGSVYECVVDPVGNRNGGCQKCDFCKEQPCAVMECRASHRNDGEYVYFVKKEGGEE